MIGQHEPAKYAFEKEQVDKEHHILSPNPEIMQGLTRKERQLKQLLFMALDQLYSSKNAAEIRYWYTEWSPELYGEIQVMDFEDVWNRLYEDVKYGWTEKHSNLCENLIKGQAFFLKNYGS